MATQQVRLAPQRTAHRIGDLGESPEGSNNWVIAPSKTTTGRPILANDPHRAYTEPSLRYISDLNAPTLHVIGANEPAFPASLSAITTGCRLYDIQHRPGGSLFLAEP